MAIILSFIWPLKDPANLLALFLSFSINLSNPDEDLSSLYRHIKVSFTEGFPPFSSNHLTYQANSFSFMTQLTWPNDSMPQVTSLCPLKYWHPDPSDPAPVLVSKNTIILASKSGVTLCYCYIISYRDCLYYDHHYTYYIY